MSKQSINVVIKDPGQPARKGTITNDLDGCQSVVGGFIEQAFIRKEPFLDLAVICNEEARMQDPPLEQNIATPEFVGGSILGTLFVCRVDDEGEFVSLKPDEEATIIDALNRRSIV
jgi:Domain of unknown function (DUF3846)